MTHHTGNPYEAVARRFNPYAVAGLKQLQRPCVPRATARANETVLHGVRPRTRSFIVPVVTVEFAVPRFRRSAHDRSGTYLSVSGV